MLLKVTGDDEADYDFRSMPSGLFSGREWLHGAFSNMQSLVSRAGLLAPLIGFDVFCLVECDFCDHLKLVELHLLLTNERDEAESRAAQVRRLEERLHATEKFFGIAFRGTCKRRPGGG